MPSCVQIRPPSLPPFFSHGNSNLSDGRVDLAQSSFLSPTPHSSPALYRTGTCAPPSLPSLSFALSLPFPLPLRSPIAPLPCLLPTSFRAYFGISYPLTPRCPHSGILRLRSSPLNFTHLHTFSHTFHALPLCGTFPQTLGGHPGEALLTPSLPVSIFNPRALQ